MQHEASSSTKTKEIEEDVTHLEMLDGGSFYAHSLGQIHSESARSRSAGE